jgi:RNA polymerase sigma-70 factor (ECF subfamily)
MSAEDLRQHLFLSLFVSADGGERPRIAEYAGRGSLRAWLRVVLARIVVDHVRTRSGREPLVGEPHDARTLAALEEGSSDPDLAYAKRFYGRELRRALERAFRSLSAPERAALRHRWVEGLSIDRIAVVHGLHRASAARRVQRAEERLGELARRDLRARLQMGEPTLASVLRLVRTEVPLAIPQLFASHAQTAGA